MNEISTKLVYVDYKSVIKNYKKPAFWQQRWKIYDYSGIVVELAITGINTLKNYINLGIDLRYAGDKKHRYKSSIHEGITSWSNDIIVPIKHPEYTQVHFQKAIYGEVRNKIHQAEMKIMENSYIYKQERNRYWELKDRLKETAEEFLDSIEVSDDDLREIYIDAFVDRYKNEGSQEDYIRSLFYDKVLAKDLLLWASFNNELEEVEKYSAILKQKKVSKSTIRIWLQKQKDAEFEWDTLLPTMKGNK